MVSQLDTTAVRPCLFDFFRWATWREKTHFVVYVDNKGADQTAHPRSLISAFVLHFLWSICEVS